MKDDEIKWVTINGSHVPLKEGETTEDAIKKLKKKHFEVRRKGWMGSVFVVPETDIEKYQNENYEVTDIDIDKELDAIDKMDLNASYNTLKKEIRGMADTRSKRQYLLKVLDERIAEHQTKLADEFLADVPKHKDISLEESAMGVNSSHYDFSKHNPDYHSPEYAAYTYNCQRCVQAFVLRYCYGYDVEARPAQREWDPDTNSFRFKPGGDDEKLFKYGLSNGYGEDKDDIPTGYSGFNAVIFNRKDVSKTLVSAVDMAAELGDTERYIGSRHQLRYINKTLKAAGDGAVYICNVCWKGTKSKSSGVYSAHTFCIINEKGKIKFLDPQNGSECSAYFTENQIVPKRTVLFRADNCRLNGTMMKEVVTYEKSI